MQRRTLRYELRMLVCDRRTVLVSLALPILVMAVFRVAPLAAVRPATEAARSYAAGARAEAAGRREEAREYYRQALSQWQAAADPAGQARTLTALATVLRSLGEPREAAELFRQALPLWQTLGDRENEARTLNLLGLTVDDLGRSATARQRFEQALRLRQELGDRDGEAVARLNLCLALQRQGEFAEARVCYETARALFRELGDAVRETVLLSNLAGVHWKLGEPDRALALYGEVLARSRAGGHGAQEGRTLTNRALLYYELGEAEEALLDYDRALAIFRRLEDRRMEATILSHLGHTYLNLGELDRARTLLEQALPLRRAAGDRRGVASTLRGLGQTYGRLEQWPKAFDAYRQALALSRRLEDRRGEASVRKMIGEAHTEEGSLRRAVAELRGAVELLREIGDRRQQAQTLLELARAHRRMNDPEQALVLLDQALGIFRTVRDRAQQVRTLEVKARAERDRGRTGEALADTAAAALLLEDLRLRAGGLRQRASFFAARRGVYELRIDLLMDTDARQAFAVSEAARARALLDLIGDDRAGDAGLQQRLRAARRRLAARVERQMAILGREHDEAEATAADREVYAALAELEALRAEARRQRPRPTAPEALSAARVAELLDPGTLLLEYSLGEERSFVWAVTRDSFAAFELPGRAEIEALARRAHAELSTLDLRTGRTAREAWNQLGRMLLDPVAEPLDNAQRLAVVADGALHYLPFAAFPRPGSEKPLVVGYEVVHLPSASTLAVQRRRPAPAVAGAKTIAILADPVFELRDPRLAVAAGQEAGTIASADVLTRVRGDLGSLGRLPATRREAEAIAALVGPGERLLALGVDAHRQRVLEGELADYRYLHFATHGLINSRLPELSGLVLSLRDGGGRPRNGFLGMDDVYGLRLGAELVVLSGCRTALGREIRGEGLVGLTHGFMVAGAARVVAGLWPVRDQATAELMTRFYHGMLEERRPPAAALAAAQRSIRQERQWTDPFFWAAFVLVGDWR